MRRGFTLIELLTVVALIGLLAMVAIPKLSAMVVKSKEGATKTNLGTLRSALAVYYADNEGLFPEDDLSSLSSQGKYLSATPVANIYHTFHHPSTSRVEPLSSLSALLPDTGGWAYVSNRSDPDWGKVLINCTHPDIKAAAWSAF